MCVDKSRQLNSLLLRLLRPVPLLLTLDDDEDRDEANGMSSSLDSFPRDLPTSCQRSSTIRRRRQVIPASRSCQRSISIKTS